MFFFFSITTHLIDILLFLRYYEMKEKRQINNEAAIDKADWEKYTAQNKGGLNWNDLTS